MQLDQTYLSAVLPSQGRRIYCYIMPGAPGNRVTAQFDFDPADALEADKTATWALQKSADVYVCIGGAGPLQSAVKTGPNAGKLRISRDATNSMWHRSLRIDIDISTDPNKSPYATKKIAWDAFKVWMAKVPMPAPLVVDSGYGLHIYWPFDRDIATADWLPLAHQLKYALETEGLVVDSTTTVDSVRILRVPGTFNFKNGTQAPVRLLTAGVATDPAVLAQTLAPYQASAALPVTMGAVPSSLRAMVSPLTEGLHPPYFIKGVFTQCPGLGQQAVSKGASAVEPLWHATLAVINKAADDQATKDRVARAISAGHPGFNDSEFNAKWQQIQIQGYEPPTCEKFAAWMPECRACPLRHTMKSPVVMGRLQPQLAPSVGAIPPPAAGAPPPPPPTVAYQQTQATVQVQGIFAITTGMAQITIVDGQLTNSLAIKDGYPCHIKILDNPVAGQPPIRTLVRIGEYRITGAERLLDTEGRQALTALIFDRAQDGHRRVEISHKELSDARGFNGLMQQNGVYFNATDSKVLQDKFMPQFLAQLQRLRSANTIASRCGWTSDFTHFILGTRIYGANSNEHIRPAGSPQEMEAYHTQGDRALWRQAFDLNILAGPERQAILALGMAGPLMAFAGVDGVLLNAYSPESGVGKSTLCDAVLSIWGSPDRLRKDYRDTAAATFHLASISGNIPMVIDEFTNVDGRELSNYVYTITQGRERHRLGSDAKLRDNVNRWCLPAIATSNNSVHDKLQSFRMDASAEAARVFEMRLRPLQVDPAHMGGQKRILQNLKTNYGFMGPELCELFMQKGEQYWRQKVTERISWWDAELAHDTGDRFRSVVAALIDIGAALGEAMGYGFNRVDVVACVRQHWEQQVREFEEARLHPQDFLTNYLTDHITKFVVLGVDGLQQSPITTNDFVGEIRTYQKSNSTQGVDAVRIPLAPLRKYITERNGNWKAITEWCQAEMLKGGMCQQTGQMRFMSGTPRSMRAQGYQFSPEILGHTQLSAISTPLPVTPLKPKANTP